VPPAKPKILTEEAVAIEPVKPGEPSVLQQLPLKNAVLQPANQRFVELKFVGEKLQATNDCRAVAKVTDFCNRLRGQAELAPY
jgi:hypothetical protein